MPTRMPVVNGTRASPASAMTWRRRRGSLSGEPKWTSPRVDQRCSEVVSSIMPIDGAESRSACISASDITPGLRCGRSPVSRITMRAISPT